MEQGKLGETAMEAIGFFEYFVAYVSAIATECTSDSDGSDFGQDIMSLFGNVNREEEREPPAGTQRQTQTSNINLGIKLIQ